MTLCAVACQAPLSMGFSRKQYWNGSPFPSPVDLPDQGSSKYMSPALAGRLFTTAAAAKSLQSCPTLCDPIDGSPPGSPVPGILQARTLEWDAMETEPYAKQNKLFSMDNQTATFFISFLIYRVRSLYPQVLHQWIQPTRD